MMSDDMFSCDDCNAITRTAPYREDGTDFTLCDDCARDRGYLDDENRNETRAEIGVHAIVKAAQMFGAYDSEDVEISILDILADMAHACDKFGLDPESMFERALYSYHGDSQDGPKATHTYDASLTLRQALVS